MQPVLASFFRGAEVGVRSERPARVPRPLFAHADVLVGLCDLSGIHDQEGEYEVGDISKC